MKIPYLVPITKNDKNTYFPIEMYWIHTFVSHEIISIRHDNNQVQSWPAELLKSMAYFNYKAIY